MLRSTDLMALPAVDCDKAYAMQLTLEETLLTTQTVYFQVALLYPCIGNICCAFWFEVHKDVHKVFLCLRSHIFQQQQQRQQQQSFSPKTLGLAMSPQYIS